MKLDLPSLLITASYLVLSCSPEAIARAESYRSEASTAIVVNGQEQIELKQVKALDDAVAAYQDLSSNWFVSELCDIRELCDDEKFNVKLTKEYVQLFYTPNLQFIIDTNVSNSIKLASFPIAAVNHANYVDIESVYSRRLDISYVKLQKSLSILTQKTNENRRFLYNFPNAQDNPFFPWPPKTPSDLGDISADFEVRGSLGSIANRIKQRISPKGYDSLRYFSVPGGFAMVTDLERVARHGSISPENRWTVGKRGGFVSIYDYWNKLLKGENDRFRVFVFIVTDADIRNDQAFADQADLKNWKAIGRPGLSNQRSAATALPGTKAWLYVYEFKSSRSKDPELIQNDRDPLRMREHKQALGLP
ncbi:hypothetical protein [Novosphingobium sp. B 225]|uniref:hypothetical protein n=1 Tax=Novosphingobium sp. B 225 TaxID=1961849 RepID=UPI001124D1CB|nr:hypothetical protein [Novosphingobium sp. B 225]